MFSIRCMYIFLWKFGVRFYRTDQFGGYCKSVLRSRWYAGKRGKRIFVFFVERISSKFSKVATPSLFISVLFYSRALHREINPQRVKFSTPHVSGQCHPLLLNPFGTNVDHGREPPGTYVYGWRRLSPMAPSSIIFQLNRHSWSNPWIRRRRVFPFVEYYRIRVIHIYLSVVFAYSVTKLRVSWVLERVNYIHNSW